MPLAVSWCRWRKWSNSRWARRAFPRRKFFPGYVLVEMEMNDDSWHLVKSTPKVTGFVGGTANKPTPISEKEVEKIMQQMQEGVDKPRPKVLFEPGEVVRVKDGPFTDFHGAVEQVNYEKNRLRVSVTIFGRPDAGRTGVWASREGLIRQVSCGAWRVFDAPQ
jgi:transcriptional antiterminator NusG